MVITGFSWVLMLPLHFMENGVQECFSHPLLQNKPPLSLVTSVITST